MNIKDSNKMRAQEEKYNYITKSKRLSELMTLRDECWNHQVTGIGKSKRTTIINGMEDKAKEIQNEIDSYRNKKR